MTVDMLLGIESCSNPHAVLKCRLIQFLYKNIFRRYCVNLCINSHDARLYKQTLTCFLRVVQGVSEGEEFALKASSMSRLSWSSFLISWLIDSDQGDLTCRDSCG